MISDYKTSPILRETAKPVEAEGIGSKKIRDLIARMNAELDSQEDGVAIAAPQVGSPLRLFIVSGKIFKTKTGPNIVFINPALQKLSKKKQVMEEGCLSVRWLYGKVERSEKATVRATDENGKVFTKGGSGLLAQAFQHEMDHLDGVLFIDKATDLKDAPPKEKTEETTKGKTDD